MDHAYIHQILTEIQGEVAQYQHLGKVADYIPALKKIPAEKYAMVVTELNGHSIGVGDLTDEFSIQSTSKVFTLTLALKHYKSKLWRRVGKEPSGNPFNSLVQLEYEHGIPRNPFINAWALVVTDALISTFDNPLEEILTFLRTISNNPNINVDEEILASELAHGYRNAALVNFMKSAKNIDNDVDTILYTYFAQCSIKMNIQDLSRCFLYLANHGINPFNNEEIITSSQAKRINALMLTCGMYDEAGEFAFRVGLPGKSGVSGTIATIVPKEYAIAVWSPGLNKYGNSYVGVESLERFTNKVGKSIF